MRRFFAGFLAALILLAVAGYVAVRFGLVPASADVPPGKLERQMAHMSLNATIAREAPAPPYPYPSSEASIVAGSKLYIQHCSMCHGTAVDGPTILAKGQYVMPPQFVKHGVDDDPEGKIYWNIEHGIRFTGMPSYKTQLTEEQIWQLAYFLKNVPDHLPAAAQTEWHRKPLE
jgi:thiosulfate dehydrogenase